MDMKKLNKNKHDWEEVRAVRPRPAGEEENLWCAATGCRRS